MSPRLGSHFRTATALAVLLTASAASASGGMRTVSIGADTPSSSDSRSVAAPKTLPEPKNFSAEATPVKPVERSDLSVLVDRAKVIRLPERTSTVIIGNPAVADVAIQKNGVVVLTGKSFGVTNFLALDGSGNMLAEANVSVKAPADGTLVVQRGLERFTYSCTPACQPSVALGDNGAYFGETRSQVDAHAAFAGGGK